MSYKFEQYTGRVPTTEAEADDLTLLPPVLNAHRDELHYLPDDGLKTAVNVALALGQPLLVSGAPGCGKTQLAYSIAKQFGLGEVLKISITSNTQLADLYYRFDHMAQFRDLQRSETRRSPETYLRVTGLGEALLRAGGPDQKILHEADNVYAAAETAQDDLVKRPLTARDLMPEGFFTKKDKPRHCVVLLDEIDKAPRDTPNDMLGWLEDMSFTVSELGIRIAPFDSEANPKLQEKARRPVVVITTNGEKRLPDAFLRRCAFYHIEFPDSDRLLQILAQRGFGHSEMVAHALEIFKNLREGSVGLSRAPGLAEFIGWVVYLSERRGLNQNEPIPKHMLEDSLVALLKNDTDRKRGMQHLLDRFPDGQ